MRVDVLNELSNVVNTVVVNSETDLAALGITNYTILSDTPQPAAPGDPGALRRLYEVAIQKCLDEVAQSYGYDSIYTACTYADEPAVPAFQVEGQALRAWRSRVWAAAIQIQTDVESGKREAPSVTQLLAELPAPPQL